MKSLTLLIKPVSNSCNMRCKYCFYSDVTDIREVKSRGIMSLDTLELLVRNALREATVLCTFGFQGGEPTLAGVDFFRALVTFAKKYNINNARIGYSLQTNGILIDDEWAALLAKNGFLTGVSIDAAKQVHDGLRTDTQGKETHNQCMKATRILTKHKAEFNIISVVTNQLAAHPDNAYNFYKRNGFLYIQFVPCLDGLKEAHGSHFYSLDAKMYGKFLCRIFDLWYADFIVDKYISIRTFDNYIHMLAGYPPESCAMSGTCSAYALVEADGSVYPCDFYAIDEFLLGNIATHSFTEMLTGDVSQSFIAPSKNICPTCKECEYLFICRGGCRRDREPLMDGVIPSNYLCVAYKMFFAHALPRMRSIASQVFGKPL